VTFPRVVRGNILHARALCGSILHARASRGNIFRARALCGNILHARAVLCTPARCAGAFTRARALCGKILRLHASRGNILHLGVRASRGNILRARALCGYIFRARALCAGAFYTSIIRASARWEHFNVLHAQASCFICMFTGSRMAQAVADVPECSTMYRIFIMHIAGFWAPCIAKAGHVRVVTETFFQCFSIVFARF